MNKRISILLVLIMIACIWAAGQFHDPLLRIRTKHHINTAASIEKAPPLMTFSIIALGGFRGLLVDVLWLRASFLQDQNRFFELVQLADWITKLEPHATEVWTFHARNMAFNISTMMPDPEDKWRWVRNGISLLRDEGLSYNSNDPKIYNETGWLFQNKIGSTRGKSASFLRIKWAQEIETLLGSKQIDYETLSADKEKLERMEKDYKLIPKLMAEIEAEYGKAIDWRLPEAHALYWAYRGQKVAAGNPSMQCDRMIYQAMAALFVKGSLIDSRDDVFKTTVNINMLPGAIKAFEQALNKYDHKVIHDAFEHFLGKSIKILYVMGHKNKALDTFQILNTRYPSEKTKAGFKEFLK